MVSKISKSKPISALKQNKSSINSEKTKQSKNASKINKRKPIFNISVSLKRIINLWLLISLISIINTETSTVLLKFNKTGTVQILGSDFSPEPNRVFVNETQLDEYTNIINVENFTEVKLEWDSTLTSCKNMFKDLIDVIEIDLSNFNSNSVTDTSSMFQNCTQLSSLNLNGFRTSLVTNMNSMFNTVRNLVSFDISNFDTSTRCILLMFLILIHQKRRIWLICLGIV